MSHALSPRPSALRWMVAAFAVSILAGTGVAPAAAMQDPGVPQRPPVVQLDAPYCFLTRIGTQLVRCDDLTGAGVPAPAWVPER